MNAASTNQVRPRRRFRFRYVVFGIFALFLIGVVTLALSFRMGGEARVLRQVVLTSAPEQWTRKFELGVGRLPVMLVRAGLNFAPLSLDPRARAGLRVLQSADVGIYQRRGEGRDSEDSKVLTAVRTAMQRRGWEPLVTVRDSDETVAIFVPGGAGTASTLRACVLVMGRDDLVLVSARANTEALLQLVNACLLDEAGTTPRGLLTDTKPRRGRHLLDLTLRTPFATL